MIKEIILIFLGSILSGIISFRLILYFNINTKKLIIYDDLINIIKKCIKDGLYNYTLIPGCYHNFIFEKIENYIIKNNYFIKNNMKLDLIYDYIQSYEKYIELKNSIYNIWLNINEILIRNGCCILIYNQHYIVKNKNILCITTNNFRFNVNLIKMDIDICSAHQLLFDSDINLLNGYYDNYNHLNFLFYVSKIQNKLCTNTELENLINLSNKFNKNKLKIQNFNYFHTKHYHNNGNFDSIYPKKEISYILKFLESKQKIIRNRFYL